MWCRKHHTLAYAALLALPTATVTFAGGGTLLGLTRPGRSASTRCWRLLLLLLLRLRLRRLLLLLVVHGESGGISDLTLSVCCRPHAWLPPPHPPGGRGVPKGFWPLLFRVLPSPFPLPTDPWPADAQIMKGPRTRSRDGSILLVLSQLCIVVCYVLCAWLCDLCWCSALCAVCSVLVLCALCCVLSLSGHI